MPLLRVSNAAAAYGKHMALADVDIEIDGGEIVVILGANGAGKSTLLRVIAGLVPLLPGGSVTLGSRELAVLPPHEIVEAGIALVPEGRGIFADLTVRENLAARRLCPPRPPQRQAATWSACWSCSRACKRALRPAGAHHERRRAADGGDRPRHDVGARVPAARRALARPVAAAGARAVRVACRRAQERRRHPAGRAERQAEPAHCRSRLSDRDWPHRRPRHRQRSFRRPCRARGLSRRRRHPRADADRRCREDHRLASSRPQRCGRRPGETKSRRRPRRARKGNDVGLPGGLAAGAGTPEWRGIPCFRPD